MKHFKENCTSPLYIVTAVLLIPPVGIYLLIEHSKGTPIIRYSIIAMSAAWGLNWTLILITKFPFSLIFLLGLIFMEYLILPWLSESNANTIQEDFFQNTAALTELADVTDNSQIDVLDENNSCTKSYIIEQSSKMTAVLETKEDIHEQRPDDFNAWYCAMRANNYASMDAEYDSTTLDGIAAIPATANNDYIPVEDEYGSAFTSVSYRLERKATEHKQAGNLELAIACLRKANEINSRCYNCVSESACVRIIEYLKQQGKFSEAREEQKKYNTIIDTSNASRTEFRNKYLFGNCEFYNTHLVITGDIGACCSECAKYRRRIFSLLPSDTRYPQFPLFLVDNPSHCGLPCYSFNEDGSSYPHHIEDETGHIVDDPIAYSNRPFIDDRNPNEIAWYKKAQAEQAKEILDRRNYDWLRENLPDIAPKSFGGYRRMQNQNT
ncbi:MAG: hypothetical protein GXZ14_01005, partial [Ruminococcaceae bacterium]|nr:hypothetical protein [Oscillospiraceae bacterium]